jgi:hypothetical protein
MTNNCIHDLIVLLKTFVLVRANKNSLPRFELSFFFLVGVDVVRAVQLVVVRHLHDVLAKFGAFLIVAFYNLWAYSKTATFNVVVR